MIEYPLKNGLIEAGAPVEVGHNTGHFWFSSLHQVGEQTLVCTVVRSADVAQGKWPAQLFVSEDAGATWRSDTSIETMGHASIRHTASSTLMMPYELWPDSPRDMTNGKAMGTMLTKTANGTLEAEPREIRFCGFPAPFAKYHEDGLFLLHSGNILRLGSDGSLFTTLYGVLEGSEVMLIFAVVSNDGGFTWNHRSTVVDNAVFRAPEGPNESTVELLDNGDLLCIYRVSDAWDFNKSYSRDEGRTWSEPMRMDGMRSVQPRLARLENGALVLTGGRPGLFLWLCADGKGEQWETVDLATHHNRLVEGKNERFSEVVDNAEAGKDPSTSTSYTGIMPWGADGVIVTYDRLSNGWSGAPGPHGDVDRVYSITLKVSI
jgi:hypothetical protein